jgi:hypothetical protein
LRLRRDMSQLVAVGAGKRQSCGLYTSSVRVGPTIAVFNHMDWEKRNVDLFAVLLNCFRVMRRQNIQPCAVIFLEWLMGSSSLICQQLLRPGSYDSLLLSLKDFDKSWLLFAFICNPCICIISLNQIFKVPF